MSVSMKANPKLGNMNGWQDRHNAAIPTYNPLLRGIAFESAMVAMLRAWAQYADDHKARYDSAIGDAGVLGAHWQAIGLGLRGLLNGDCGARLDCGTLDAFIMNMLQVNGCEEEL